MPFTNHRSFFKITTVSRSMSEKLVYYHLISSFLVITRLLSSWYCFLFSFWEIVPIDTFQELCYTRFATTECSCTSWNFPVSEGTGIFLLSLLDLLTLPCWECIRSYWHCRDTDFVFPCVPYKYIIAYLLLFVNVFC